MDAIQEKLIKAGVAITQQRLALARLFMNTHRHCTAEMLVDEAKKMRLRVSKATVYNTLRLFLEKGLARQVVVNPQHVFFDSNMDEHHHLYDESHGTLMDIPVSLIPESVINHYLATQASGKTPSRFVPKEIIIRGRIEHGQDNTDTKVGEFNVVNGSQVMTPCPA